MPSNKAMEQSGADVSREVVDLCALHVQRYAWLAVLLRKESPAAHRQVRYANDAANAQSRGFGLVNSEPTG